MRPKLWTPNLVAYVRGLLALGWSNERIAARLTELTGRFYTAEAVNMGRKDRRRGKPRN